MVIRRTKPRNIRDVIREVLKENHLDKGLQEQELIRRWYEITGRMIANATKTIYIRDRKLFVNIHSAVIRNEISLIKDGLITELNQAYEEPVIDDIILK
ncbi:MAG: DUF721 domain-containing protein [Bacteroidetes bacterium]|jgi:hypothetical protein|nr:DUF721 domain-containing protein [Bacteroidota bacterium]MBT3750670.1 DUF721 domain-containing protein [Bacteroidota bacterium]MBT4399143.1 DUF721 domain-containing protein [Bacteroidota bacterium]MBT4409394.1 DUF721 domain-containing protein [Bacteroidota bacterium]MBT7092507.1 DUF721 domain-containing protein [Bacteroidota bacterium]